MYKFLTMEARLCTVVIGMSHFAPRLGIFILNYVAQVKLTIWWYSYLALVKYA